MKRFWWHYEQYTSFSFQLPQRHRFARTQKHVSEVNLNQSNASQVHTLSSSHKGKEILTKYFCAREARCSMVCVHTSKCDTKNPSWAGEHCSEMHGLLPEQPECVGFFFLGWILFCGRKRGVTAPPMHQS